MDTIDIVTRFLAILAIAGQAAVVCCLLLWIASRVTRRAARTLDGIATAVAPSALALAALVAATAMVGSLYFSEGAGFKPCPLCWYQRIAMYALAIILVMAAVRRDRGIRPYALTLASLGLAVSIYHYQLERFPDQTQVACDLTAPCTAIWFEEFGYITIPMLAGTAFLLIITTLLLQRRSDRLASRETSAHHGEE